MVNQWGRDGNTPSSGGRGAASIVIPVIVALALGGGAGYGGARFTIKDTSAEVAQRDQLIEELKSEISEAKFSGETSSAEQKQLQDEVAALNGEIKTLQSKIKTLQKGNTAATNLANQLSDAEDALAASRARIQKLESTLAEKTAQTELLKANGNILAALQAERTELQAALADARRKLSAVPALQDEIASLKEELSDGGRQVDRDTEIKLEELATENRRLRQQLRSLTDRPSNDAVARERELQAGLDKAQSQYARAVTELDRLREENNKLSKTQKSLESQIAKLKASGSEMPRPKPSDNNTNNGNSLSPRSERVVRTAVDVMPGVEKLTEAERGILVNKLVSGECVTTSLKLVFGSVPKAALRDLLRELGGNC